MVVSAALSAAVITLMGKTDSIPLLTGEIINRNRRLMMMLAPAEPVIFCAAVAVAVRLADRREMGG